MDGGFLDVRQILGLRGVRDEGAGDETLGNERIVRGLEAGQVVSLQGSESFGGRSAFGFSVAARICRLALDCYRR